MTWLDDPRAGFVIAAYSVATIILISMLLISLWKNKKCKNELQQIQEQWKVHKK
jgi:hypothetical protein